MLEGPDLCCYLWLEKNIKPQLKENHSNSISCFSCCVCWGHHSCSFLFFLLSQSGLALTCTNLYAIPNLALAFYEIRAGWGGVKPGLPKNGNMKHFTLLPILEDFKYKRDKKWQAPKSGKSSSSRQQLFALEDTRGHSLGSPGNAKDKSGKIQPNK